MNKKKNYFQRIINIFISWADSAAGIISLILIGIIILLLIVVFCIPDYADNWVNIFIGLATTLMGIIITVTFVQNILNKQDKKTRKNREREKIVRANKVLQMYLNDYWQYYICVTVPMNKRSGENEASVPDDFDLIDMQDMFKQSLLLKNSYSKSSVQLLYDAEDRIHQYFVNMISNIDFEFYPEMLSVLTNFMQVSTSYDARSFILSLSQMKIGEEKADEFVFRAIREYKGDCVADCMSGKLRSNMMIPIVLLYKMIKNEREILKMYEKIIEQIE